MNGHSSIRTIGLVGGLVLLIGTGTAQAYIDPGTQAAVATSLAGFLALFAGFFGIVLWPARKLLNLKELQTVVVKGKVKRDEAGNFTMLASGVFVRG